MHKHTESPYAAPSQLSPNSRNRYSMTLGEEREIKKPLSDYPHKDKNSVGTGKNTSAHKHTSNTFALLHTT